MTRVAWPSTRAALRLLLVTACLLWAHRSAAAWFEVIGPGVYRFAPGEGLPAGYVPTPAFVTPPVPWSEGAAAPPATVPVFSDSSGRQVVTVPIDPGTSLYGLGEAGGRLLRNGQIVTGWNTDAYGYGVDESPLYQTHPWVLAVRADGTAWGLLADTSWRIVFDLRAGLRVTADGPPWPVVLFEGASPRDVLQSLARFTGTAPLPPLWALGYHQCRFSYDSEARARAVAEGFRSRKIPCDVLWLDIDYMNGYRCFTFDPARFPDPARLDRGLDSLGFHTVWMIDCGIKKEAGYPVYDSGEAGDHWVLGPGGRPFVGSVWPGPCVFPDFLNAGARAWWSHLYRDFMSVGIDGVWNDMNEPSVFNVPEKTMPSNAWHDADPELGGPGPHARYHNLYGMEMARATREGIEMCRPGVRPFVLTRAGFLGSHRYAATWTGDNSSTWEHLAASVPMVLSLGLSGQPFSGPDIGGYKDPGDDRLFARWIGLGAFLPFARGHTAKGNPDKEPWAFGDRVERVGRAALQARYRLLPYLYTLFEESHRTGLPVMRPLFFADPVDPGLRGEDEAFLLGDGLLVQPNLRHPGGAGGPRLPGRWREWAPLAAWNDRALRDDLPRLFVAPGAIVAVGPVKEFVGQVVADELELVVSLDAAGQATGRIYEDAGDGPVNGPADFRVTVFRAARHGDEVDVTIDRGAGGGARPWPAGRRVQVTVLAAPGEKAPARVRSRID